MTGPPAGVVPKKPDDETYEQCSASGSASTSRALHTCDILAYWQLRACCRTGGHPLIHINAGPEPNPICIDTKGKPHPRGVAGVAYSTIWRIKGEKR